MTADWRRKSIQRPDDEGIRTRAAASQRVVNDEPRGPADPPTRKDHVPKRYTVVGSQPILDHGPGETFEADIPTDTEAFLLSIGALKVETSTDEKVKRLNVKSYTPKGY